MAYYNSTSSDEYGTEQYGPYRTEEQAHDGFFRLVVSATVAGDEVVRVIAAGYGDREIVDADDQQATTWTEDYKDRIYHDDAFCRRERRLWEKDR